MSHPDFNLLVTLDVLLAEGSVARASKRLGLSSSAMSRALARLREATGDPLLVRAGRGLVASPRALDLRERVARVVEEGREILHPAESLDLDHLVRTFTLRVGEGFTENFGPPLLDRVSASAPGVLLRLVQKPGRDSAPLRDGTVDLETGVVTKTTSPELRVQPLFQDRFVCMVRKGHPLARGELTRARYVGGSHIGITRESIDRGPIDAALETIGVKRKIATVVGSFSTALALARATDLIATVPERHTGVLRSGMHTLALPIPAPTIKVAMLWHPRMDADLAHRWLRECVRKVCG